MRAVFTCVYVSEMAREEGREWQEFRPTLHDVIGGAVVQTYGNRPCAASLRTLLHSAAAVTLLQTHCCTLCTHAVIITLLSDLNGASKNGVLFVTAGFNEIRDDCFEKWPTLFEENHFGWVQYLFGLHNFGFSYRIHHDIYSIRLL